MHWYLSWALKKGESSKCRAGGKPWEVGRGGGGLTSVTAKPLHHARIPSPPGSPWCGEGAWLLLQACFRKEARRDGWSPAGVQGTEDGDAPCVHLHPGAAESRLRLAAESEWSFLWTLVCMSPVLLWHLRPLCVGSTLGL